MALIQCPECGRKNISDTAETCPSCGFKVHDYILAQERIRQEAKEAARLALENDVKRKREAEEQRKRLDAVQMPAKPSIVPYVLAASLCLVTTISSIVVMVVDGFSLLFFLLALVFAIFCPAMICLYRDALKRYRLAQTDFPSYQQIVLKEEDQRAREEAARQAQKLQTKRYTPVRCPKCGSASIATVNRGYSLIWGFIGSGQPVNVCQSCGHKFKPGK